MSLISYVKTRSSVAVQLSRNRGNSGTLKEASHVDGFKISTCANRRSVSTETIACGSSMAKVFSPILILSVPISSISVSITLNSGASVSMISTNCTKV